MSSHLHLILPLSTPLFQQITPLFQQITLLLQHTKHYFQSLHFRKHSHNQLPPFQTSLLPQFISHQQKVSSIPNSFDNPKKAN